MVCEPDMIDMMDESAVRYELRCSLREVDRLRTAIQNCLDWANGRETEWGERAENAFQFLYDAVEQENI